MKHWVVSLSYVLYFHLGFILWTCCMFFVMIIPFQCFRYVKREHLIDVTEVFRVVNAEKKFRIAKLALYLSVLIVTIFRFVTPLKSTWLSVMLWLVQCYCLAMYPSHFLIGAIYSDSFCLENTILQFRVWRIRFSGQ